MTTSLDIAKVTRPLLSVHRMLEYGHRVTFSKTENFIELRGSNQTIKSRKEGRLYMLDVLVNVPWRLPGQVLLSGKCRRMSVTVPESVRKTAEYLQPG